MPLRREMAAGRLPGVTVEQVHEAIRRAQVGMAQGADFLAGIGEQALAQQLRDASARLAETPAEHLDQVMDVIEAGALRIEESGDGGDAAARLIWTIVDLMIIERGGRSQPPP
jgi:uncharacterized protein YoaH (UPF0181 family)